MRLILVTGVLATLVSPFAFGQTGSKTPTEDDSARTLERLNQDFGEAQVQRDEAKLNGFLTDDFTLINPAGRILNKSQFLVDLSSGDLKYESLNYDDTRVRVYGDVAVILGRVVRKGQYKGQDNSGQFRFIHVFVKQPGRWRIAIAQATRIAP